MDDGDAAQAIEEFQRKAWIDAIRARATEDRWKKGAERDCIGCGDPIPDERLSVLPGAVRCARCQEIYERTMRMRGTR